MPLNNCGDGDYGVIILRNPLPTLIRPHMIDFNEFSPVDLWDSLRNGDFLMYFKRVIDIQKPILLFFWRNIQVRHALCNLAI